MSDDPIGFIGLGNMGGRIARRIIAGGRAVLGFDLRPDAVVECGATPAESIPALAQEADVVLLSLPDSRAVESVLLAEDGQPAWGRAGQVVVDLSTSSPESTRHLARLLAERGAIYLDAGISGGAAAAEAGTLTLMVGGDAGTLERIRSVLDLFASKVYHCGESGTGHTAKLLNNFLNAIALSATAEVMVAAKQAGLDLQTMLDILNSSSGINFATLNRFPRIIHGDYLKGGLTNALMMKDVTLYVELLGRLGVISPNSAGPLASFGLASALGYADQISNTVVDAIGDMSGGIRLYDGGGQQ